jgi:hypothetical protein
MDKIRVGLYGTNGHQINGQLAGHPLAELAAVAGFQEACAGRGRGYPCASGFTGPD